MKIALLGATGPSGQEVVNEAIERGYEVTAIVRNPDKLAQKNDKLKVVKADIYDEDSLVPHFQGQDAVLSCLGVPPSFFSLWTITFYTDTAKHIVSAMRKVGVTRLILVTAWYTKYVSEEPFIMTWVIKPLLLGQSMKNMGEMEDYLEWECTDIEYTSVRPPRLTNTETTGKPVLYHDGQLVPSNVRMYCCRRDVARFMLDAVESGNFKQKCIAIASG